jgi:hypothetical protein
LHKLAEHVHATKLLLLVLQMQCAQHSQTKVWVGRAADVQTPTSDTMAALGWSQVKHRGVDLAEHANRLDSEFVTYLRHVVRVFSASGNIFHEAYDLGAYRADVANFNDADQAHCLRVRVIMFQDIQLAILSHG